MRAAFHSLPLWVSPSKNPVDHLFITFLPSFASACMHAYTQHQEDVLLPTATPRETLFFAASLKLPASVSAEEKQARCERILVGKGRSYARACVRAGNWLSDWLVGWRETGG